MSKNVKIDGRECNGISSIQAFDVDTNEYVSFVDTSDATATSDDILKDKTAYVNGEKVMGTGGGGVSIEQLNAVRDELKDDLVNYVLHPVFDNIRGKYISEGGVWTDVSSVEFTYSDAILVPKNSKLFVDNTNETQYNRYLAVCAFFKSPDNLEEQTPYGTVPYTKNGLYEIDVPDGYSYVVFNQNVDSLGRVLVQPKIYFGKDYIADTINKIYNELGTVETSVSELDSNLTVIDNTIDSCLEFVDSENLFNCDSDDMKKEGWWYHNPTVGSTLEPEQNNYTQWYVAIKIPVNQNVAVTFTCDSNLKFYGIYAVDYNMKILKVSDIANTFLDNYTFLLPEGTFYVCISIQTATGDYKTVMCASGTEAKPFVPYTGSHYKIKDNVEVNKEVIANAQSIIGTEGNSVKLILPSQYELVVGDTFELFYKGIVNVANLNFVDVVCTCSKGKSYTNKYVYTPSPSDVGTKVLMVTVYGINHNILDTKNVNLVVKEKAQSPTTEKIVLYVGDSLASGGFVPGEFKRRLTASGGTPSGDELTNIAFIGTQYSNEVNYEGYGGWSFNSYITENKSNGFMWITTTHSKTSADQHSIYKDSNDVQWKLETIQSGKIKIIRVNSSGTLPESGTLTWVSGGSEHTDIVYSTSEQASGNPFWDDSSNKVDFASYVNARGKSTLDYVYVLLGWNNAGVEETTYKTQVRTFIDNVLESYPDCKIVLLGLQVPARDGLAENYGANNGVLSDYYRALQHVWNLNKWYSEIALESAYANNVSFINIAGQFDTEHNMITSTRQVNTRNSATETYQSNGVHPARSGYYQIADACWRDFHHKLQS